MSGLKPNYKQKFIITNRPLRKRGSMKYGVGEIIDDLFTIIDFIFDDHAYV